MFVLRTLNSLCGNLIRVLVKETFFEVKGIQALACVVLEAHELLKENGNPDSLSGQSEK